MSGLVDSAHAGSPPGKAGPAPEADGAAPQGSPPAGGSSKPPLAPAPRADSMDRLDSGHGEGSSKGWKSAKNVLGLMRVTGRFSTLRDLVHTDAYIEPSRLKMVKHLGEVCCCECAACVH